MQLLDLTEGRPAQVHDVPRVPFQLEGWMDTLLVGNFDETRTGLVQLAAPYLHSRDLLQRSFSPPPFFSSGSGTSAKIA